MTEPRCERCGHVLTRRKYARKPTPHTTNRKTPEGRCGGCRDCFQTYGLKGLQK